MPTIVRNRRGSIDLGTLIAATRAALLLAAVGDDPLTRAPADGLEAVWTMPQRPVRIHGRSWLVGSASLNVVAIDTGRGLILIDGGPAHLAPPVERNLALAGFSIRDVKLIVSSESHYDHAGALAALRRDSGATIVASRAGALALRAGDSGPDDPQRGTLPRFPAVDRVRIINDGGTIRLGDVTITAHATPGHTPGSMSVAWRSCEPSGCAQLVFVASLSVRTNGRFRFVDRPDTVGAFRRGLATLRALPCDRPVTAHPIHPEGDGNYAQGPGDPGHAAFRPPGLCRSLADRAEQAMDREIDTERRRSDAG